MPLSRMLVKGIEIPKKYPRLRLRIYSDGIDILIDMGLFTAYSRMDIFSIRPAPVQVAWLGLATTTGAGYYDYIVGDPVVIREGSEVYFSGTNLKN